MRDAILVLGAHRSGTSALGGVITRLGAVAPKRLMPESKDNERGYYESVAIADWHDELLMSVGTHWHDWRGVDAQWLDSPPESAISRALALLADEFGEAPLFLLKDPRICRFVPLWLSVLRDAHIAPRVIISFRNPFEVAQSLRVRDNFSIEKGLLIWLRHVLDSERETRGLPRSFIEMDAFLTDWRNWVRRIARDIGITWPRFDDKSSANIDEFLNKDLKHHNVNGNVLELASGWLAHCYEALSILSRNPSSKLGSAALDKVSDSFEQACNLFGPVLGAAETQVVTLQADIAEIIKERITLPNTLRDEGATANPIAWANEPTSTLTWCVRDLRTQNDAVGKSLEQLRRKLSRETINFGAS